MLIGCLASKSEALFTSRLFFNMAAENRFILILLLMDFEGIGLLKDNASTQSQKCRKKVVKLLTIIIY